MADRTRKRKRVEVPSWRRHFVEKYQTDLIIRINRIMERKGWSQKDLKEKIGWSRARVSQVLSGDKNLTLKTISKLENALNEDILEVPLEEDEEEVGYSKLLEKVHHNIEDKLQEQNVSHHLTVLRSFIFRFGEERSSQEDSLENWESSYYYDSYR